MHSIPEKLVGLNSPMTKLQRLLLSPAKILLVCTASFVQSKKLTEHMLRAVANAKLTNPDGCSKQIN